MSKFLSVILDDGSSICGRRWISAILLYKLEFFLCKQFEFKRCSDFIFDLGLLHLQVSYDY